MGDRAQARLGAVPAQLPGRRGIAGGIEAIATSTDVHVSWDAKLGSPPAPGRSTQQYVLFRAISGGHRVGAFKPRIGCIPTGPTRTTTLVHATIPGAPLNYAAATVKLQDRHRRQDEHRLHPDADARRQLDGNRLQDDGPPRLGFAQAIQVKKTMQGKKVGVTIAVSEALPPRTGARCSSA